MLGCVCCACCVCNVRAVRVLCVCCVCNVRAVHVLCVLRSVEFAACCDPHFFKAASHPLAVLSIFGGLGTFREEFVVHVFWPLGYIFCGASLCCPVSRYCL